MDNRTLLHSFLKTISHNVYFQPPTSTSIIYPAIVYSRKSIVKDKANNKTYMLKHSYTITIIDRNPDSIMADKILQLDYCEFDRQFITEGLNHIVFTIFY